MNYYTAKQRQSDMKWDYTRNGSPAGYCRQYVEPDDKWFSESQKEKHTANKSKYHVCGHETREEAEECYKQHLLDHNLRFSKSSSQQTKCKECGEWTQNFAEIGCQTIALCDEHNTSEGVAKIFDPARESWSSW